MPSEKAIQDVWQISCPETGSRFLIRTAVYGKTPPRGYSVCYLLDGETYFQTALQHLPPTVLLVGADYDGPPDHAARARDYTPPSPDYTATGDKVHTFFGGAAQFYRFLECRLKKQVSRRFQVDAANQTLFGHSYGGLFALYVLLNHPATFRRYLISSPSVWWNGRRILQDLPAFAARQHRQPLPLRIALSVGADEEPDAPPAYISSDRFLHLQQRGMVRNTQALAAALSGLPALETTLQIYPHTGHAGAAFTALSDGIAALGSTDIL